MRDWRGLSSKHAGRAAFVLGGALLLAAAAGANSAATSEPAARVADAPIATAPAQGLPAAEPDFAGSPVAMRRLTESQYRNSIAQVFDPGIKIEGRFEPDRRVNGLIEVGSSTVSISPAGFEQYLQVANGISAKVTSKEWRGKLIGCAEAPVSKFDAKCAEAFFDRVGRKLYRRPLTKVEKADTMRIARASATQLGDMYGGIKFALNSLLTSPNFLFRLETVEPDPTRPGKQRLDAYSTATRLSFFLTDGPPDDTLLQLAASGTLHRPDVLQAQAERLINGPLFERTTRSFFRDMLGFDGFAVLSKDTNQFPAFDQQVRDELQEQTLLNIVDQLLVKDADYRGLFTRQTTFMTRRLGGLYAVPVTTRQGWEAYNELGSIGRAGILTEASFLALHSHPGRSSPTLRGKFIRETFLCQHIPPPPPDVDFASFEEESNANRRTARDRLTVHRTQRTCAGCHKLMDPIGLALERFNTDGSPRETENGAPIDTSGDIDGVEFKDAVGLGKVLAANPRVSQCVVSQIYRYGAGRDVLPADRPMLAWYEQRFAGDGYRFKALIRAIATSRAFYTTATPKLVPATKTAQNTTAKQGLQP